MLELSAKLTPASAPEARLASSTATRELARRSLACGPVDGEPAATFRLPPPPMDLPHIAETDLKSAHGERARRDGTPLPPERQFVDDGVSGATLAPPGLASTAGTGCRRRY